MKNKKVLIIVSALMIILILILSTGFVQAQIQQK